MENTMENKTFTFTLEGAVSWICLAIFGWGLISIGYNLFKLLVH